MTPQIRQRWMMLVRLLCVSLGGYALGSLAAAGVSAFLPWCCGWSRAEGVLTGSLFSFLFYLVAVLWLFSVRRIFVVSWIAFAAVGLYYALFSI